MFRIKCRNIKNKKCLIILSLILLVIIPVLTVPSYNQFMTVLKKYTEFSKIYENWLIVKSETIKYMFEDPDERNTEKLVKSISNFEILMDNVLDRELFKEVGNINDNALNEIATVLLIWQQIQLNLVETVLYKNNFDIFASEIYNFTTETDYFEKNLKKILLYIDSYLQERTNHYRFIFIIIVCFTVLLLSLFVNLVLSYNFVVKRERKIRELSQSIMKIRDHERLRISLDLHDVIVQNLLMINKKCENRMCMENGQCPDEIIDIRKITERVIKAVREISCNLRPQELDRPLKESLQVFCCDFSVKNRIEVDFKCAGFENTWINEELETTIFKMIHECLFNVIRHSEASKVIVRVIMVFPEFFLRIEDNGRGFDVREVSADKYNLGLRGLKDRVSLDEGELEIKSSPGNGTSVVIKLPCRNRVKEFLSE